MESLDAHSYCARSSRTSLPNTGIRISDCSSGVSKNEGAFIGLTLVKGRHLAPFINSIPIPNSSPDPTNPPIFARFSDVTLVTFEKLGNHQFKRCASIKHPTVLRPMNSQQHFTLLAVPGTRVDTSNGIMLESQSPCTCASKLLAQPWLRFRSPPCAMTSEIKLGR
jgi:hypothetical protein